MKVVPSSYSQLGTAVLKTALIAVVVLSPSCPTLFGDRYPYPTAKLIVIRKLRHNGIKWLVCVRLSASSEQLKVMHMHCACACECAYERRSRHPLLPVAPSHDELFLSSAITPRCEAGVLDIRENGCWMSS